MVRRRVFLIVLMAVTVLSFFGLRAWADDIDVYTNNNDGVEPNILIIFDNSGSMNETIPSATYDPATTYPGSYQTDTVYYRWHGS